jgi:hypothetical protein
MSRGAGGFRPGSKKGDSMEYPDLQGRVVVSAQPAVTDAATEEEKARIVAALEKDTEPLILRLDDGALLVCANVIDGDGDGGGLLDVLDEVLLGVTAIPDRDSVYVPKLLAQKLRDAVLLLREGRG